MSKRDTPKNLPPYTPMSSLKHELGIMFGFIAACLLIMAIYIYFWRAADRRDKARDEARRKNIRKRNFRYERGGLYEKMVDREIVYPFHRVELPGSGDGEGEGMEMR